MTQSDQFSNLLDCPWLSYPNSIDSPWLNWSSLPPPTVDIWCQPQWLVVRLTLLYLGIARSLPNPLFQLTSWNPEAPAWKNKRLTPPLSPHKPLIFSFKNPLGAAVDPDSARHSTASNKGTWIRSSGSSHLYFSRISTTYGTKRTFGQCQWCHRSVKSASNVTHFCKHLTVSTTRL